MKTLRTKYRPKTFKEFLGNKTIVSAIKKSLDTEQIYLFYGEKGCGKTTLARLIARYYKIDFLADVYEIDGATHTSVADARSLRENAAFLPSASKKKIYIIDECHRLSPQAMDALLKITEEPPEHILFCFCTTNISKVPGTLRDRAADYEVSRLRREEIEDLLHHVIKAEQIKIDRSVFKMLVKRAQGNPRIALKFLGKVRKLKTKKALSLLRKGTEEDDSVKEIISALIRPASKKKWSNIKYLIENLPEDSELVRHAILAYLSKVLQDTENPAHILAVMECFLSNTYDGGMPEIIHQIGCACDIEI